MYIDVFSTNSSSNMIQYTNSHYLLYIFNMHPITVKYEYINFIVWHLLDYISQTLLIALPTLSN